MHEDLIEVVENSKRLRKALWDKEIGVKEANSHTNADRNVVSAHAIDLRERVFMAESAATIERIEGGGKPASLAAE